MRGQVIYTSKGPKYFVEGKPVTKEEFSRIFRRKPLDRPPATAATTCWPMVSDSHGVHPDQIKEVMERNKKHGLTDVSYDSEGRAIIGSRASKKKLNQLEGWVDKAASYSDSSEMVTPLDPKPIECST